MAAEAAAPTSVLGRLFRGPGLSSTPTSGGAGTGDGGGARQVSESLLILFRELSGRADPARRMRRIGPNNSSVEKEKEEQPGTILR